MPTTHSTTSLDEQLPSTRARIAAAWASFALLYASVDILGFYKPGVIDDILDGVVWEFPITLTWVLGALTMVAVPILMITLSMTVRARVARMLNLVVAVLYIPVSAGNALGESSWLAYYVLSIALEVGLLAVIFRLAWTWPAKA